MEGTKYTTKEAVLKRGQEAIGIPLKDIDKTGRISTGKGAVGSIIEESWFGYSINSESGSWRGAESHTLYQGQKRRYKS